jgi:hypothetical protein
VQPNIIKFNLFKHLAKWAFCLKEVTLSQNITGKKAKRASTNTQTPSDNSRESIQQTSSFSNQFLF